MNTDLEKIKKLRDELHYHNYLYYNLNKSIISDFEFDNKLKDLIDLEKKNPLFLDKNSPSQRVGGSTSNSFKTIASSAGDNTPGIILFKKFLNSLLDIVPLSSLSHF